MLVVFQVRVATVAWCCLDHVWVYYPTTARSMLMSVAPDAMEAMGMAGVRASTYCDVGMQWPRCPRPNSSLGLG